MKGKKIPRSMNRKVSPIGTTTLQGMAARMQRDKVKTDDGALKRRKRKLSDLTNY
jgi:hypothetical protein